MKRLEIVKVIGAAMNGAGAKFEAAHTGPHNDADIADFYGYAYCEVADAVATALGVTLEPATAEEAAKAFPGCVKALRERMMQA